jgi:hypothetical protein
LICVPVPRNKYVITTVSSSSSSRTTTTAAAAAAADDYKVRKQNISRWFCINIFVSMPLVYGVLCQLMYSCAKWAE